MHSAVAEADILLLDIIGYKRHLATSQLLPFPMRSCGNLG
jgi:hypothetical protein